MSRRDFEELEGWFGLCSTSPNRSCPLACPFGYCLSIRPASLPEQAKALRKCAILRGRSVRRPFCWLAGGRVSCFCAGRLPILCARLEHNNSKRENKMPDTHISEIKKAEQEISKSRVRVGVTYAAAFFLFIVGPIIIVILLFTEDDSDTALSVFNTLLPVAAAIISFWFAGRGKGLQKEESDTKGKEVSEKQVSLAIPITGKEINEKTDGSKQNDA